MNTPLVICYHGTDEKNVSNILYKGFKKGTYFARHLENAIHMGGPHVFGVAFDATALPPHWQFTARSTITPGRIVHYRIYSVQAIILNDELQEEVLQSNLALGQDYCDLDGPA